MPARQPCLGRPCTCYAPGHQMHFIHAKQVGRTPWGWRDGVVTAARGCEVTVQYLQTDHTLRVWHHRPLPVVAGQPVRVHEQFYVLGGPVGWANVVVTGGLGAVPEPEAPELWRAEQSAPVVDLSEGYALPEQPQ